jgi:hypothetical protein
VDVRNALRLGVDSNRRGDVCLTPAVDNVLVSADWVISG